MVTNIVQIIKWDRPHLPTEEELKDMLRAEGLTTWRWENDPYVSYMAHMHKYHKTVVVLDGTITFGFSVVGEPVTLRAGDRLELPANVMHNSAVGPRGVVCLEARH